MPQCRRAGPEARWLRLVMCPGEAGRAGMEGRNMLLSSRRLHQKHPIAMAVIGLGLNIIGILLLAESNLPYKNLFIMLGVLGIAMNAFALVVHLCARSDQR
jgi:hypothetical protein